MCTHIRRSAKVSRIRTSRSESVHFLASFDFTLFLLVFLPSVFPLSLSLFFHSRRTFPYRDRLKFRWKSHFSLSNSKCAFEYRFLKLELKFRTFYTAIHVKKVRRIRNSWIAIGFHESFLKFSISFVSLSHVSMEPSLVIPRRTGFDRCIFNIFQIQITENVYFYYIRVKWRNILCFIYGNKIETCFKLNPFNILKWNVSKLIK